MSLLRDSCETMVFFFLPTGVESFSVILVERLSASMTRACLKGCLDQPASLRAGRGDRGSPWRVAAVGMRVSLVHKGTKRIVRRR